VVTTSRLLRLIAALVIAAPLADRAAAADLAPYRARYALSLASTDASGGVIGGGGMLLDEWRRTCDGWTEQEHFYLHLQYGEDNVAHETSDSYSTLATWEASDASRFSFDLRRASTDQPYEEIRGEARRTGAGGSAVFTKPQAVTLALPRGTLFPAAHNRLLVERAQAGDRFIVRRVFDGSDVETAAPVSAVIGPRLAPGSGAGKLPRSRLLDRPSWQIRLAFFSADRAAELPEYEESVRLLDNGVVQDMVLDYGDHTIHAQLEQIEALPRPRC
jgi:envelope integrity protein B